MKEAILDRKPSLTPFVVSSLTLYGTLIFPILGLVGWISGHPILASFNSYFIPMAPSTGICFLLLSLPLFFFLYKVQNRLSGLITFISATLVLFYCVWIFIFQKSDLSVSPDLLFFGELGTFQGKLQGHMAPSTALMFILSAVTQIFIVLETRDKKNTFPYKKIVRLTGLFIAVSGLLFTIAYALEKPLFYQGIDIPMALTTALTFVLLGSTCHLMANPHESFFGTQIKRLEDVKIELQMKVGFALLLFFVMVLGLVSYRQTERVHRITTQLYQHPLQVQRAIGSFRADVLAIHRDIKDLFIASDEAELETVLLRIENWKLDANKQLEVMKTFYLGPGHDIDSLELAFARWNQIRGETIRLFREGELEEAANRTQIDGISGSEVEYMLILINKVENFARSKADELYANSELLNKSLTLQLILLVLAILLLTIIVNYLLLRNIQRPLNELISITRQFREGKFSVRSTYRSNNEFGILSASFNQMAKSISSGIQLSDRMSNISSIMLTEDEPEHFFRALLTALAQQTGAQMAAVYLLSDDRKYYRHFDSIGLNVKARDSFSAATADGEFGMALATGKIQHLRNSLTETAHRFETVEGSMMPRSMIIIPMKSGNQTHALISLATVGKFKKRAQQLCEKLHLTMSARIEAILETKRNRAISRILELQNSELEAQKTELSSQSAELMMQNSELEMQKNQLDEASRLKTIFLSNMSHELRTPLNSVIALSGVLNRRLNNKIPEEEHSYIEVIERNGKHLLELINDILDISRIEAGREDIELTTFNLNELINSLIEMIRPQIKDKNVQLIHHEPKLVVNLTSDTMKIRHILQNLIGNAVKFTEEGKVEITVRNVHDSIEVKVQDTGIGIGSEQLPLIFDEFRQADSSTSRKYGGTGLGLAIAKKYAQMLGGNIVVKSEPDKGSEFVVILPLKYTGQQSAEQEEKVVFNDSDHAKQVQGTRQRLSTILLVEDSEPAIIQLSDILDDKHFSLMIARNGQEALEMIKTTIPDAMVLDLMMPEVDGFRVLETIRGAEATAHVPVLILTARHISKDELSFLKRNKIHQLIQKGNIQPSALITAIESMLQPEQVLVSEPATMIPKKNQATILLVEDNPDNLITARAILDEHFKVLEATDGLLAVELARKHLPDLILMDIQLPQMDGIQAFKTIRNNSRLQHIPIIALTASAMTSERETILAHGFDAYIAKPINESEFIKTIQAIIYGK